MNCQRCNSNRIASITAKCSDCCGVSIGEYDKSGYVPGDMGIGGGDYIDMNWCLECGQIQGTWPLDKCKAEEYDPKACIECGETNYFNKVGECGNCGHHKELWCPRCDNLSKMTKTSIGHAFCDIRGCKQIFSYNELEEAQP